MDGLCGIYAVVNAACFLARELNKEAARDLFRVLNEKLRKRGSTSDVVWGGMCPALVWPMLIAAQTYLREELEIAITVQGLTSSAERLTLRNV